MPLPKSAKCTMFAGRPSSHLNDYFVSRIF